MDAVYFSKVEFHQCYYMYQRGVQIWGDEKIIFLDIPNQELSVQIIRTGQDLSNRVFAMEAGWRLGRHQQEPPKLMVNIRNGKNGMQKVRARAEDISSKVIFSKGVKLSDEEMRELLPYCNALDFEPFRDREMSMDDPGYRGYRDEITMWFRGITDSYIPKIELPMEYVYDEKHTWPSERLYQFIMEKHISDNKKLSSAKIYRKV